MVIIDFTKNSFLSSIATIRIQGSQRVPDDFIWFDTYERCGEMWFNDPRTGKKFKKKLYGQDLRVEFKLENRAQLKRLEKEYGKEQLYIDIGNRDKDTNHYVNVLIKNNE